jgi:hypothetical protein
MMTPEQITAMVQALGYPICVSIAMFAANALLMRRYFAATDSLIQLSKESSASLDRNSEAMQANTRAIEHMSSNLCRFPSR